MDEPGYLVDAGAGGPHSAVEIFAVDGPVEPVALVSAAGAILTNGLSDSLPILVDAGLPAAVPVLASPDSEGIALPDGFAVATEGIRRQQDAFGGPFRRTGTMTASEPFLGERAIYDYLPDGVDQFSTYRYLGIEGVTASSSGADVTATFNPNPAHGPWSAVDPDPLSAWHSASWDGAVDQWIEVSFVRPIAVGSVEYRVDAGTWAVPDAGRHHYGRRDSDGSCAARLRPANARRAERVDDSAPDHSPNDGGWKSGTSVGVSNLAVPGITPERTLDVPTTGTPDALVFTASPGYRSGCLTVSDRAVCNAAWMSAGEEDLVIDRSFAVSDDREYQLSTWIRLRPSAALADVLDQGRSIKAQATSTDGTDLRHRPGGAVDGDETTAWVSGAGDLAPALTLQFERPRPVEALRIVIDPRSPIARPTRVAIRADDIQWEGALPIDGLIRLPSVAMTDQVRIAMTESVVRPSTSTETGGTTWLPVGISEVRFDPGSRPAAPGDELRLRLRVGTCSNCRR